MRVHLGKVVCESACVYGAERDESFLSLLSSSDPTTTALHISLKLFSLPCHSAPLFKKTSSFPLCSFHSLIFFSHTRACTHAHTPTHTFPLTSFLRQFIWLAEKKMWRKEKSPWNPQNATERKAEQSVALSPFNSPSLQSLSPSTCTSPTLYLQLPVSLRPCRMTWHEWRRHR